MNDRLHPIGVSELRPFLRYARKLRITPEFAYNGVVCYDARLIYVLDGSGSITVDGHSYALRTGCLVSWQAGQCYSFSKDTDGLSLVMLNLDYAQDAPEHTPISPDKPDAFDEAKLAGCAALTENADRTGVLYDPSAYYAEPYLHELLMEYTAHRVYSEEAARGLLTLLLSKLCRHLRQGAVSDTEKSDALLSYIHAHIGERMTYESLGQLFSYHPCHINRIITRVTGMPLHRYLMKLRCEYAFRLLCDEGCSVSDAAGRCGYSDAMSFAKSFRRQTGMSPSEARRRGR